MARALSVIVLVLSATAGGAVPEAREGSLPDRGGQDDVTDGPACRPPTPTDP